MDKYEEKLIKLVEDLGEYSISAEVMPALFREFGYKYVKNAFNEATEAAVENGIHIGD